MAAKIHILWKWYDALFNKSCEKIKISFKSNLKMLHFQDKLLLLHQ